jgi:hypothetical protein
MLMRFRGGFLMMDLGIFAGRLEKHCKWMTAYLVALPLVLERMFLV